MNSTYEFTLKEGPKMKMKFFRRTKSWRNFLEKLNLTYKNIFNPNIFTGNKNIFNQKIKIVLFKIKEKIIGNPRCNQEKENIHSIRGK